MRAQYSFHTLACVVLFVSAAASQATHDGRWWLTIDERHRDGTIRGFEVCYSNFVDRKLFQESSRSYSARLSAYLRTNPGSLPESIDTLLPEMARPPLAKPVHRSYAPNESPKELAAKWGANNDGDEWRGFDSWQLGYVEGFLGCYSRYTKSELGTFSKPAEWYVKAIADWYGAKADDPAEIDPSKQSEKIPDVLFRFADKNRK